MSSPLLMEEDQPMTDLSADAVIIAMERGEVAEPETPPRSTARGSQHSARSTPNPARRTSQASVPSSTKSGGGGPITRLSQRLSVVTSGCTWWDILVPGVKLLTFALVPWIIIAASGFSTIAVVLGAVIMTMGLVANEYEKALMKALEKQVDRLKAQNEDFQRSNEQFREELGEFDAKIKALNADCEELEKENAKFKAENEKFSENVSLLDQKNRDLDDTCANYKNIEKGLTQQVNILKNLNTTITSQMTEFVVPEVVEAFQSKLNEAFNDEAIFARIVAPLEKTQKKYEVVLSQLEKVSAEQEKMAAERTKMLEAEKDMKDEFKKLLKTMGSYQQFMELVKEYDDEDDAVVFHRQAKELLKDLPAISDDSIDGKSLNARFFSRLTRKSITYNDENMLSPEDVRELTIMALDGWAKECGFTQKKKKKDTSWFTTAFNGGDKHSDEMLGA